MWEEIVLENQQVAFLLWSTYVSNAGVTLGRCAAGGKVRILHVLCETSTVTVGLVPLLNFVNTFSSSRDFITFCVETVFCLEERRHAWALGHEDCFTSVGKGVDAECGLYFI